MSEEDIFWSLWKCLRVCYLPFFIILTETISPYFVHYHLRGREGGWVGGSLMWANLISLTSIHLIRVNASNTNIYLSFIIFLKIKNGRCEKIFNQVHDIWHGTKLISWYLSPTQSMASIIYKTTGCFFFNWYPPKKLKYGKPRLGESTAT